jgi:hypothetical protein
MLFDEVAIATVDLIYIPSVAAYNQSNLLLQISNGWLVLTVYHNRLISIYQIIQCHMLLSCFKGKSETL